METSSSSNESSVFIPAESDRAFEAILPEILALEDDDTLPVNSDVVSVATVVLGHAPTLKTLRPRVAELPGFDVARFDKLEHYALALIHAHGLHRGAQQPKGPVLQLGNELTAIRDRLYSNAVSLAENGLLDGERLKECKRAIGYRATVTDIYILVPLFKEYWPQLEGKTPVTPAALHDATTRAAQLLTAIGLRDQNQEQKGEKAQIRAKAYTLFLRAYEDARNAVEFLRRHEEDAHEFAPSLFAGRGGRRREDKAEGAAERDGAAEGSAAASVKASRAEPPPQPVIENPEGLPIDSPFTN